jgi:hypothetical protein
MCSYRCCFIPGVPARARVTDVAAVPLLLRTFLLMVFLAVPAFVSVSAIVGFPAVFASFPAVNCVPAVAGDPVF